MRSFVKQANGAGIKDIVAQQSDSSADHRRGLVPIVEPGSRYSLLGKAKAEELLKRIFESLTDCQRVNCHAQAHSAGEGRLYAEFVKHPKVVRWWRFRALYTGRRQQALARITASWRASRERW